MESVSFSFLWQFLTHLHCLVNLHGVSLTLVVVDLVLLIVRHDRTSLILFILEIIGCHFMFFIVSVVFQGGVEASRVVIGCGWVASLLLDNFGRRLIEAVVIIDTGLLHAYIVVLTLWESLSSSIIRLW